MANQSTDRTRASHILDSLREKSVSDTAVLEYIIYNYLSGAEALEVMKSVKDEFSN